MNNDDLHQAIRAFHNSWASGDVAAEKLASDNPADRKAQAEWVFLTAFEEGLKYAAKQTQDARPAYTSYDQTWEIAQLAGHVLRFRPGVECTRCGHVHPGAWAFNFNCPGGGKYA